MSELSADDFASDLEKEKKPVLFRLTMDQELVDEPLALLAWFSVEDIAHQEITTLPQGARKLIDITMATVANPDLIFLDDQLMV